MTTATLDVKTHEFDVEDIEYLRHGDKPLLARVFRPRGEGPFPALVECHGGAWCLSDRTTERLRHEAMATHGIVSIALDFRSGNEHPYPAPVQDINYALRWTKLSSRALKTRADLVGLSGQSSGGHLAMLVAMRPRDPRYAAIPLPPGSGRHDATVRCVVMSWPVINPLSRYRLAQRALAGANPPEWPKSIIPRHDAYWRNEANMAEGNPMLALERDEKVATPPAIWFQGRLRPAARLQGRAAALRCELPQGRRRDHAGVYRCRAARWSPAGPVEDRRHVRAHGGVRGSAHQG